MLGIDLGNTRVGERVEEEVGSRVVVRWGRVVVGGRYIPSRSVPTHTLVAARMEAYGGE